MKKNKFLSIIILFFFLLVMPLFADKSIISNITKNYTYDDYMELPKEKLIEIIVIEKEEKLQYMSLYQSELSDHKNTLKDYRKIVDELESALEELEQKNMLLIYKNEVIMYLDNKIKEKNNEIIEKNNEIIKLERRIQELLTGNIPLFTLGANTDLTYEFLNKNLFLNIEGLGKLNFSNNLFIFAKLGLHPSFSFLDYKFHLGVYGGAGFGVQFDLGEW